MNSEQQEILNQEYINNPNWSSSQIYEFAMRLGLTRTKVYKWNWDRRNKSRTETQQQTNSSQDDEF